MPQSLQKPCVEWYHEQLLHPGITRTEETIRQHFYWKNLREDIQKHCRKCHKCQLTKKKTIAYGKLPEKEAEAIPWDKLCVDLIGPYKIKSNKIKGKEFELYCLTMIDPATSWLEIAQITNKEAITIAQTIELAWFTRYPWPQQIVFDRGKEFMGEFREMVTKDYHVKAKPITTRNPQANAIVERVHQTMGNMIRTFEIQEFESMEDGLKGIIHAVIFAIKSTYHTTLKATPMQLVFGRDAILNTKFEANWEMIRKNKQRRIKYNNEQENKKRKDYTYQVGQKVLVKTEQNRKYGKNPYQGIYEVTEVHNNGTVTLRKGAVTQTFNICMIHPYLEE